MNVLWIEDFGGNRQSDSAALAALFAGLVREKAFDDHWGKLTILPNHPEALEKFVREHSDAHGVTLLRHYGDFVEKEKTADLLTDYDVIAIDIDLSKGAAGISAPADYTDPSEFHSKAGIYIYNHLVRAGFPADHMCFFTANTELNGKLDVFVKHCHDALIPPPGSFEKDDEGIAKFRGWLDNHRQSPYMTLRRGVIAGCKHLRRRLADAPDDIQFNRFRATDDPVSTNEMDDYLLSLSLSLPPKPPSAGGTSRMLRLLARAIAHEWEGDTKTKSGAHPGNLRNPRGRLEKSEFLLRGMGWVMKMTRNWLAHSQALNTLTAEDVAYLFIVNIRAMFVAEPQVRRFEKLLLTIFQPVASWPDEATIKKALRDSFIQLSETLRQNGDGASRFEFHYLANDTQNLAATDVDYVGLLYQVLWHQLAQRPANSPGGYECDCRDLTFRLGNGSDDFLKVLLSAIYGRSFLKN